MGLFSTAAIIAVIAILVAGALFLIFTSTTSGKLTVQKAEALVVSDIKTQNPNANVTQIGNATNSSTKDSWLILLSVVYNGSRPCPTVQIEQFDYPAYGLSPTTETQYSSFNSTGCHVPPVQQNQQFSITLPVKSSIAIATSYASGSNAITSYVNEYGYNNTSVTACFKGQGSSDCPIFGNETNIWLIRYKASGAANSLYAELAQNGTTIDTYNVSG
jgi:hypothetical protein